MCRSLGGEEGRKGDVVRVEGRCDICVDGEDKVGSEGVDDDQDEFGVRRREGTGCVDSPIRIRGVAIVRRLERQSSEEESSAEEEESNAVETCEEEQGEDKDGGGGEEGEGVDMTPHAVA